MVNNVDFQGTKAKDAYEAATNVNYFYNYAFIAEQKKMLSDHIRMKAYHSAIFDNKDYFQGKVVLDVGAGSGVLSMWCAQAGAAHVYAVEYTDMALHARELIARNGLSDRVTVIQSSMEDVELGEGVRVDAIVSEWMGLLLFRESMLDTVIYARDNFLKPGGTMWPSHAAMYWSMISAETDRQEMEMELTEAEASFQEFVTAMQIDYGLDYEYWREKYRSENENYYVYNAVWRELQMQEMVGEAAQIGAWDLSRVTAEQVQGVEKTSFRLSVPELMRGSEGEVRRTPRPLSLSGFAGWFTVQFNGSNEFPAARPVELSTAPEMGYTHWGQEVCFLRHALSVYAGDTVSGSMSMTRRKDNKRTYQIELTVIMNTTQIGPYIYDISE